MHRVLTGRGADRSCFRIVASVVLDVPRCIDSRYECHGLTPRSEGPIQRQRHEICAIVDFDFEALFRLDEVESVPALAKQFPSPKRCGERMCVGAI